MAADVTLLALRDTPENRRMMAIRTWRVLLEGDEEWRDEDGEVTMVSSGEARYRHTNMFFRCRDYDWFEVGPWSPMKAVILDDRVRYIPGPQARVYDMWHMGHAVTRELVTQTMIQMNVADMSSYRSWSKRGTGSGKRRRSTRTPRPRQVKKWLLAHEGWLVWAESW